MLPIALASMLATQTLAPENQDLKDARMKWWREARFGMFIHWGLYAIPAGKWGDRTSHGEWIRDTAQIPLEEYDKLKDQFNPVKFDADEWARIAKDAGIRYVVVTSKHHDGFALWPTKQNADWNVAASPFKRDILKELSNSVRREGMTMCFYHSIMDWHHSDYLPRRPWEKERSTAGADFERFNTYLRNQVSELLTNYGPIGVIWFDGEWESTWSDKYGVPLYNLCRTLQPNTIVNNRVSNGRGGMEDSSLRVGDFSTPEQHIPATGLPGLDWETCMTMNDHWGYNAYNDNWKSTRTLIRNLVDIASKGGNYLLNVGPKADGTFPTEAIDRLKEIGQWMKVNGDAIYGTEASRFEALMWGRSTTKGSTLYLHVFDWPEDGKLVVPGLGSEVLSARVLGGSDAAFDRQEGDVVVTVPAKPISEDCTVVELRLKGEPIVYRAPTIELASEILIDRTPVVVQVAEGLEVRYTLNGSDPTAASELYRGPFDVDRTVQIRAASFRDGKRVSQVVAGSVTKVAPEAAAEVQDLAPGLRVVGKTGSFERVPDLSDGTDLGDAPLFAVPTAEGKPLENVARQWSGYLKVPEDGVYRFELTSDDGAILRVGSRLTVDNDGLHSTATKSGSAALAKGWHPLRLSWFNGTGGAEVAVRFGRVGQPLRGLTREDVGRER
ncbi:MAG TPA: alpha-L-fucosidase [Fimbriimonas sp.]